MNFFYRTIGLLILIILSLSLSAEINNIQYEGTWNRSYYYDWGFAEKEGKLYVGAHNSIEIYNVLENGDLTFQSLTDDFNGILVDLHIAGDSLYVVTSIINQYEKNLYIYDISQNDCVQTVMYQIKPGILDNIIFSDNNFVYFYSFNQESYYLDRVTGGFNEIDFPVRYISNYIEPYLFDSVHNESEDLSYVRIRDISDLENPTEIHLGMPGTLAGYGLVAVNDSTIVISASNNNEEIILKFYNISDISNPLLISQINTGFYDPIRAPVLINDNFLFISPSVGGSRFVYNISDIHNPTLECQWFLEGEIGSWKTISLGDNFYVKRGSRGIAKYNINQIPFSVPDNYFGKALEFDLRSEFDGNNVINYKRDKIIKKEYPEDEGTILYQDESIDNYNGGFACNDSLVIVKNYDNGLMDIKLIETESGEIKSSYEDLQYCTQIKYYEPYFYMFSHYSSNFRVYEVESNWNLIEVANVTPSGVTNLVISDFCDNKVWVCTGPRVFLYDTNNFENYVYYPSSFFANNDDIPYLQFVTDNNIFCVQYDYNQYARFFRYIPEQEPELIENKYFGEYNCLSYVEDTVISSRISFSSYLYHLSSDGLSEPYAEFEFRNNVSWFHFDEENNRIFVRKFGSYESFTYNYFVDIMEEEIPVNNEILSVSNYPNPFNPITTISFNLAIECNVSVEVFNIKGQKVKTLINENLNKGEHSIIWNGLDENNKVVGSGVYLYKVITDDRIVKTSKMMLAK